MIILAHRGYWKSDVEKNTAKAFKRALALGFGVELDIRDYKEELVISHNIAGKGCLSFKRFLQIYNDCNRGLLLALNIKADGLQEQLKHLLGEYGVKNYFVFDMSIPDGLEYLKYKLKIFTRESEYEKLPALYDKSVGVWLDEFHGHWIKERVILKHLKHNKLVCIVSPELHKRDYQKEWCYYKLIEKKTGYKDMVICTDHPEEAKEFFNG